MSKKVLILSSSPRRGGNSDTLCDAFMRGAAGAGNETEKIFLGDKKLGYCTGCSVCSRYKQPCPQKDDAAEIIRKMLAADVIVLGTPVYFYAMSAQLKTMIDRCCGLYTEMTDKTFYFLAAAAEGEEGLADLERVFDNLTGFLACLDNPVVKGKVLATGVRHAVINSKDAFWNTENVTVYDSELNGEYLGWHSRNLRLVNCRISGTQPLCYAHDLVRENCTMADDADLCFEYSSVQATVNEAVHSVKNPRTGCIVAESYGEIVLDHHVKAPADCRLRRWSDTAGCRA